MKKGYFIKAGKIVNKKDVVGPINIVDPVTISKEQYDYFQSALGYARARGFKIKLFDKNGKCFALQG